MKLNSPQTSPKTYWSIIKSCYNGRKIPIIPPLSVNGKIITNFKEKANLFKKYFSSQCNPLPNDSKLPENQTSITETKLSSFDIEDEDIYKIIKTLVINKAHGRDEVSIRMLNLCDKSIVKPPLSIIFKNCKLRKSFPNLCKKTNLVPIHKKGEKDHINSLYEWLVIVDLILEIMGSNQKKANFFLIAFFWLEPIVSNIRKRSHKKIIVQFHFYQYLENFLKD